MILFFDKTVGTVIPQLLAAKPLRFPVAVEYHENHFPTDAADDLWLPSVGAMEWTIVGHDLYLKRDSEVSALKQYSIGCFRLPGATEPRWRKLKYFLQAYDAIADAELTTPRPFIYEVTVQGRLKAVPIP